MSSLLYQSVRSCKAWLPYMSNTDCAVFHSYRTLSCIDHAFHKNMTLTCGPLSTSACNRTFLLMNNSSVATQYVTCLSCQGVSRGVGRVEHCYRCCTHSVIVARHNATSSNTSSKSTVSKKGFEESSPTDCGNTNHGKKASFLQSLYRIKSDLEREMILTIPNVLTLLRMFAAPVLGYLVLVESYHTACAVFICAGITDLLDGYIARNFVNQTSELGSFMDPLADKLLVSALFISLTAVNLIPLSLTALVITRDVCLTAGGFYVRYISLNPRPTSLRQFFDLTNRSASLQPTTISKINTAVQLSLVAFTLAAPVFNYVNHPALQTLWYITAGTTLVSGIGYIFAKDTFKLLKQSRNMERHS